MCRLKQVSNNQYKHLHDELVHLGFKYSRVDKCLIKPVKTHSLIRVFDIYGFKMLAINSFEFLYQFFILCQHIHLSEENQIK